jgi:hypothetical protein
MAKQRVSPPRIFPVATRSSRPPAEATGSADAYRQASFVLGEDVELVLGGLNLEGEIAQASSGSKFRNQLVASGLALWSRSWLSRLQALHAAEWGNYAAAFPLLRAAVDYQAAMGELARTVAAEWEAWLDADGIAPAHDLHAMAFELHPFRSAETLAQDAILGAIYRVTSDLAMPHFGATLMLAGSESTPERVMVTFGDRDFHLGLAELILGWLTELSAHRLRDALDAGIFNVADVERIEAFILDVDRAGGRRDRCRIEHIDRDGQRRYLVHNWRRTPGASAKRLLL